MTAHHASCIQLLDQLRLISRHRSSGGRGAHLGRGVRELDAHASTEIAEVAASVTRKEAKTRHDASFACAHEQRLLAEGAHDLGRVPRRYADWAALHRIAEIDELAEVPTNPRLRCHQVPIDRGGGLSLGGVACWYSCAALMFDYSLAFACASVLVMYWHQC